MPRWYEPRFEGEIAHESLPPGFLEGLAEELRPSGLRVAAGREEAQPSYRTSGAPPRSIQLASPEPTVGAVATSGARCSLLLVPLFESDWDQLRIWQDGPRTLRYEGSFRRSARQRFATWLFVVSAYTWVVTLCCPAPFGVVIGAGLLAAFVEVLARNRRRARRGVERFLQHELHRLGPAAAEPTGRVANARGQPGEQPRVRVDDPVLAVAARTAHDAREHRDDRGTSPEEQVERLEAQARRGTKF
jgi:hypothetical protein